jgi:hypothetical protein
VRPSLVELNSMRNASLLAMLLRGGLVLLLAAIERSVVKTGAELVPI